MAQNMLNLARNIKFELFKVFFCYYTHTAGRKEGRKDGRKEGR